MFKKIISTVLAVMIFAVASSVNVAAQTGNLSAVQTVAPQRLKADSGDLKELIKAQTKSSEPLVSNKSTLADYERAKRQGKGLSTTTKVLIGVGVAAAVIGIVVFAASRDKIRTF